MKPTVTVKGVKSLQDTFRRFGEVTGRDAGDILRQQGRVMARYLANRTQPFGLNNQAKKLGVGAVTRDIRKVFPEAQSLVAKGISIAESHGDIKARARLEALSPAKLRQVAINMRLMTKENILDTVDPSLHRGQRNNRGRIGRSPARYFVKKQSSVKKYIKQIVDRVGWGKAGWIAGPMRSLGKISIPAWVSRHEAPGMCQDASKAARPFIRIQNNVKYIDKICPPKAVADAEDKAFRNFGKMMRAAIKHHEAKFTMAAK